MVVSGVVYRGRWRWFAAMEWFVMVEGLIVVALGGEFDRGIRWWWFVVVGQCCDKLILGSEQVTCLFASRFGYHAARLQSIHPPKAERPKHQSIRPQSQMQPSINRGSLTAAKCASSSPPPTSHTCRPISIAKKATSGQASPRPPTDSTRRRPRQPQQQQRRRRRRRHWQ